MDRALIEEGLAGLLVDMSVRAQALRPDARLLQDLRIDGDDAAGFFAAVVARFGTDLTVLHAEWRTYFGSESLPIRAVIVVALGSAATAAATALAGRSAVLCAVVAPIGGLVAWLAGRSTGTGQPRPIRLSDVADAVERGSWSDVASTGGPEASVTMNAPPGVGARDGPAHRRKPRMVPRLPVKLWGAVLGCVAGPAAPLAATMPATSHAAGPDMWRSVCPASRHPVQVGNPRLARFWTAAEAFDRAGYGFSPLPTIGDVILEDHPSEGSAVIHTCQLSDRAYRTIHFRLSRGQTRWIGEQQSFRSGRTFEDSDAGTVVEEVILDYETEPVAGFPPNRLNILYRGPVTEDAGTSASPSLEQARLLLRRWGF